MPLSPLPRKAHSNDGGWNGDGVHSFNDEDEDGGEWWRMVVAILPPPSQRSSISSISICSGLVKIQRRHRAMIPAIKAEAGSVPEAGP